MGRVGSFALLPQSPLYGAVGDQAREAGGGGESALPAVGSGVRVPRLGGAASRSDGGGERDVCRRRYRRRDGGDGGARTAPPRA